MPYPLALLALSSFSHAEIPPGVLIDDAIVVDVTPEGFAAATSIVDTLVPPSVTIPPISAYDCYLGEDWWGNCTGYYEYSISNGFVEITVDAINITPTNGVLNLAATATVKVNSAQSPIDIYGAASALYIPISTSCDAWVTPFKVDITGSVALEIKPGPGGTPYLDATIPPIGWSWNLSDDNINVSGCAVADIDSVLSFFGLNIFDYVIDAVEPQIDSLVADLQVDLEPTIEEAFAGVVIQEIVDVAGVPLTIDVFPSSVDIQPSGLRLGLTGGFSAPAHPCVEQFGITGSLSTPGAFPAVGAGPGGGAAHHLGLFADDDLLNQALFSVWNAGLLCQTIDSSFEGLPLPIDTSLLGLLAPGAFDELFPTAAPLVIKTRPVKPPTASAQGAYDINILVDDLGLELYADLDGRASRLAQVDLDVAAGVDLLFDGATGNLGVDVAFGGDNVTANVSYNELAPEANAAIEGQFAGLVDTVAGPLLGGLTGGLAFPLPALEGFGLTGLQVNPAGQAQDKLGVYAVAGPVSYASGCDCADTGGGLTDGCADTGCSTTQGGRSALMLLPLTFALLRRRRRELN